MAWYTQSVTHGASQARTHGARKPDAHASRDSQANRQWETVRETGRYRQEATTIQEHLKPPGGESRSPHWRTAVTPGAVHFETLKR